MEHYLFTARSITHAQRMAQALERAGIHVRIRRVGTGVSKNGCGYTLQVSGRQYQIAADAMREAGLRPVRVLRVTNGASQEIAM